MSDTPPSFNEPEISDMCPSSIAIFGNYLISDRIFHFLPISNVLQCSLASNFFKKISRNYLRRRKSLEINLEFGKISQLTKLERMLENCTDFPFGGSKLLLFHRYLNIGYPKDIDSERDLLCRQSQYHDILMFYSHVFQKLPVKHLRIDFIRELNRSTGHHVSCLCENVLKRLVITRASDIVYLEILHWPKFQDLWRFLSIPQHSQGSVDLDQSNIFRSLQTLNLRNTGFGNNLQGFEKFISQLVISSPLLENIYGPVPTFAFSSSGNPAMYPPGPPRIRSSGAYLPESKFPAIREIFCDCRWMINQLLNMKPKLEVFGFNLQAITEINTGNGETEATAKIIVKKDLRTIIENCKKSLTTLVCHDSVHMISHVIDVPLVNCVDLKLEISPLYGNFEDVLLSLKAIDFQIYLCNLRRVFLIFKKDPFSFYGGPKREFDNNDRSLMYKRAKYKCISVKTLFVMFHRTVDLTNIQPWCTMAEVFPNVKSLHIQDVCPESLHQFGLVMAWNFAPEIRDLALPWNRNLELVSCHLIESHDKPCWILVTELLESICDITAEQLSAVSRNEYNEWSYNPTRRLWFKRNCRIVLRLEHVTPCNKGMVNFKPLYRPRFDRIFSWIQAKLPEFSLVLQFKLCELGKFCNPVPFYNGRIQTDLEEGNAIFTSLPRDFRTWLLNF